MAKVRTNPTQGQITYEGMGPNGVPMTDPNMGPVLKLWLLLTTNPNFLTNPNLVNRADVAKKLNVAPSVVNYMLDNFAVNNPQPIKDAQNVFQQLISITGYNGTVCPGTPDPIVGG